MSAMTGAGVSHITTPLPKRSVALSAFDFISLPRDSKNAVLVACSRLNDCTRLILGSILRKHVMIRIGGGWDTFGSYLEKIDPCRAGKPRGKGSA